MSAQDSIPAGLRVALVQDWFPTYGGAERVTEQILALFPGADVFALVDSLPDQQRAFLGGRTVTTSVIQRLPFGGSKYRYYLPLMPLAIEQFDLSGYDLVVSSSNAFAKGVLTGPGQVHVSYVHSPMRFAWDLQHEYLRETGLGRGAIGWFIRQELHRLRIWDVATAARVDAFVANSNFIRKRIGKYYHREADVVFPPVATEDFSLGENKEDFYVTVSRLVPYKRVDLVVEAFTSMPDKKLIVVGDGPEMKKVRSLAGSNVQILGFQPHDVKRKLLAKARAFVFAAQEDFGIAPVEAQASGTPVIAYACGGVLDTIRGLDSSEPTGVFFAEQSVESLRSAIESFETHEDSFLPSSLRAHAQQFGSARFRDQFREAAIRALRGAA